MKDQFFFLAIPPPEVAPKSSTEIISAEVGITLEHEAPKQQNLITHIQRLLN